MKVAIQLDEEGAVLEIKTSPPSNGVQFYRANTNNCRILKLEGFRIRRTTWLIARLVQLVKWIIAWLCNELLTLLSCSTKRELYKNEANLASRAFFFASSSVAIKSSNLKNRKYSRTEER